MIYLGSKEIIEIGIRWPELTEIIREATAIIRNNDIVQPVKPYLRYRNPINRIIAMPAFIGGSISMAGIKWIASFPLNNEKGLPRAHSVTILNDVQTGEPLSVINTSAVSAIRTAAVSGFFIQEVFRRRQQINNFKIGMTGFGIIGQKHLEMLIDIFGSSIESIKIFDVKPMTSILTSFSTIIPIVFAESWQEAYMDADVFITCTVSKDRYINLPPKLGSVQLNVSLRDYEPDLLQYMRYLVVDNWEEICRENTDIEKMHLHQGLEKTHTYSLPQFSDNTEVLNIKHDDVVMFNPMGMAAYDISIGSYFYKEALSRKIGITLQ